MGSFGEVSPSLSSLSEAKDLEGDTWASGWQYWGCRLYLKYTYRDNGILFAQKSQWSFSLNWYSQTHSMPAGSPRWADKKQNLFSKKYKKTKKTLCSMPWKSTELCGFFVFKIFSIFFRFRGEKGERKKSKYGIITLRKAKRHLHFWGSADTFEILPYSMLILPQILRGVARTNLRYRT